MKGSLGGWGIRDWEKILVSNINMNHTISFFVS